MKLKNAFYSLGVIGMATTGVMGLDAAPAEAQSIQCGATYTVVRGDTLSLIAQRAYGDTGRYLDIYRANSGVIGRNPGLIEVGAVFDIPCLDAPLTPSTADSSTIREEATAKTTTRDIGSPGTRATTTGSARAIRSTRSPTVRLLISAARASANAGPGCWDPTVPTS